MNDKMFDISCDFAHAREVLESIIAMMDEALIDYYQRSGDINRFRIMSYKASIETVERDLKKAIARLDALANEMK